MATLRKRGHRWQVQVRRTNHPTPTATFDTRREAEVWAQRQRRGQGEGPTLPPSQWDYGQIGPSLRERF